MNDEEFEDYLIRNWMIDTSDDELSAERAYRADQEAQERGYENWIEAYLDLIE